MGHKMLSDHFKYSIFVDKQFKGRMSIGFYLFFFPPKIKPRPAYSLYCPKAWGNLTIIAWENSFRKRRSWLCFEWMHSFSSSTWLTSTEINDTNWAFVFHWERHKYRLTIAAVSWNLKRKSVAFVVDERALIIFCHQMLWNMKCARLQLIASNGWFIRLNRSFSEFVYVFVSQPIDRD